MSGPQAPSMCVIRPASNRQPAAQTRHGRGDIDRPDEEAQEDELYDILNVEQDGGLQSCLVQSVSLNGGQVRTVLPPGTVHGRSQ